MQVNKRNLLNITMTPSITDYDIQAYVDNELDDTAHRRVEKFIQKHTWAHKRARELEMQKELLKQCFVCH
ncbi:MAG: anti-sigma factor family protein [Alphaproteobacteria bacterium]